MASNTTPCIYLDRYEVSVSYRPSDTYVVRASASRRTWGGAVLCALTRRQVDFDNSGNAGSPFNTSSLSLDEAAGCLAAHRSLNKVKQLDEELGHVQRERLIVEKLADGFWKVRVNYGFKDEPDVPRALRLGLKDGLQVDEAEVSYFSRARSSLPRVVPAWHEMPAA